MNKIISVAVLALIGMTAAIKLKDDDLFDNDDDTKETLKSIEVAEKAHNFKFNGISKEEEKVLIGSRNNLQFDDTENFIANKPKKANLLGIKNHYSYPRPIDEMLMQISENVLTGTNDEDEVHDTMESIK